MFWLRTLQRMILILGLTHCLAAILSGCARSELPIPLGVNVPEGFQVGIFDSGFNGPTQMITGMDGHILIAQLAGEENAGVGEVIALQPDSGAKRVVAADLFKPTGIALADGALWIATGQNLLRAILTEEGKVETVETVLSGLPFNGRSNGTLAVTPEGHLVFETSGNRLDRSAEEGSAALWILDPADPTNPRVLATGLKNAYGLVFDPLGRLWATEIADDPVNGEPPPDELNLILPGADFGWPRCFGFRKPAYNYGGSESGCMQTRAPVAIFPPHSTPTSVAISPWEENTLLVALWGPTGPSVVRVKYVEAGDDVIAQEVTLFITGLEHPQHLLVLEDRSLLVSDFGEGIIYRVTRQ